MGAHPWPRITPSPPQAVFGARAQPDVRFIGRAPVGPENPILAKSRPLSEPLRQLRDARPSCRTGAKISAGGDEWRRLPGGDIPPTRPVGEKTLEPPRSVAFERHQGVRLPKPLLFGPVSLDSVLSCSHRLRSRIRGGVSVAGQFQGTLRRCSVTRKIRTQCGHEIPRFVRPLKRLCKFPIFMAFCSRRADSNRRPADTEEARAVRNSEYLQLRLCIARHIAA
jgi:hypothetical protein